MGVECRERVNLPHTRANDAYCTNLRAAILDKIARGAFDYTEFFPESPKARTFGHAVQNRTVGEALAAYRDRSESTLEASTWRAYRRDIDNVLIPEFGAFAMADLRATHVRDFVTGPKCAGLTLKRMRNMMLPLRTVCDEAVADGILPVNPVAAVKLAKLVSIEQRTRKKPPPDPYTEAELITLLDRLPEPERWVFQLWAYTGLRTGELIGLRWPRIDLGAGTLTVSETTTLGLDKPRAKTAAGLRTFALLPAAREAVEGMRRHTQVIGDRFARNPRSTSADKAWRENKLASVWQRAHRGTGIRNRNPYQLRHTFASNLMSQGANAADIADRLGHATTEMVVRHYATWVGTAVGIRHDDPATGYGQRMLCCGDNSEIRTGVARKAGRVA